jgi:hypothetical protein
LTASIWAVEPGTDVDRPQVADPVTTAIPEPADGVRAVPGVPMRPVPAPATNGTVPAHPVPPDTVPTIGVDPGSKWTSAVLRVGEYGVTGWTLGPVDRLGRPDRNALNDPDDWESFSRYTNRLISHLEELVAYAEHEYGGVRIAIEVAVVPSGWQPTSRGQNRLPLTDVLLPRQVAAAVLGAFPNAKLVPPARYGSRSAEVPPELKGRRQPHWGPNETVRGERDHEQAAYLVAGQGARQ